MARKQSDPEKYCKQVLSGKIVACEKVKKVCQRLLNDIKTPYKQWHFDQDAAERPVRFIETFCHIPSGFDYQSECHCSKTRYWLCCRQDQFDYQSECHCSKTNRSHRWCACWFDYQSECHCSKTNCLFNSSMIPFDYQSECHCSKTRSKPS